MEDIALISTRLLLALLVGGLIGLERAFHGRPAGLRTHSLVCMSSCTLMLLSVFQWELLPDVPLETLRVDPIRMSQGIMTGIGFLGAGVIMKEKFTIRGLTTAASIWITASIGIIVGMGFYTAAFVATLLTLLVLSVCSWFEQKIPTRRYGRLMIRFNRDKVLSYEKVSKLIEDLNVKAVDTSYYLENNSLQYQMTIRTYEAGNFKALAAALNDLENITEFSVIPIGG